MTSPTFLDLFCGCGGFTLGMIRSGFHCLAAIDANQAAIETLQRNLRNRRSHPCAVDHVMRGDLTKFKPKDLATLLGLTTVDVIVGGPPCQGFSTARQVDGANHGVRIKRDARRYLYRQFLDFVDYFQPQVFVIENVLGLRSAAGGAYFTRVQNEARFLGRSGSRAGYRVHAQVEDAYELGVPQKRRRQLIVGVRSDLNGYFIPELRPPARAIRRPNLGLTIGDLPVLKAGRGNDECDYDLRRRAKHIAKYGATVRKYLSKVLEVAEADKLTNHVARPHSARDLRDFARLREGEHAATAMRKRGVRFEFPYDKSVFKDRYTRQSRANPCSTIVAHLAKDGLMFVHPTQNRSLTPREAARIQTFPDWFRFPVSRTSAYRLIGNAVPPLVGEAVGQAIARFLAPAKSSRISGAGLLISYKDWMREQVVRLSALSPRKLRSLPKDAFLSGWYSVLLLVPDLHPDGAHDNGATTEYWSGWEQVLPGLTRRHQRRYVRSGWPVALTPLAREAYRRLRVGELKQEDIYRTDSARRLIQTKAVLQTA